MTNTYWPRHARRSSRLGQALAVPGFIALCGLLGLAGGAAWH